MSPLPPAEVGAASPLCMVTLLVRKQQGQDLNPCLPNPKGVLFFGCFSLSLLEDDEPNFSQLVAGETKAAGKLPEVAPGKLAGLEPSPKAAHQPCLNHSTAGVILPLDSNSSPRPPESTTR